MLPADVKKRKDEEKAKEAEQTTLDTVVIREKERVVPYADARFAEAAEDWLIASDRVSTLFYPGCCHFNKFR